MASPPLSPFAAGLQKQIEQTYDDLGYQLGWRLLASPAQVLDGARIAVIDQNPGWSEIPADHPSFATAPGVSAYVDEAWGRHPRGEHPLQQQLQALFRLLRVEPVEVLAGHIVPFRAPSWTKLEHKKEAEALGEEIWGAILAQAKPKLVIALGDRAQKGVENILQPQNIVATRIEWAEYKGYRGSFLTNGGGVYVGLPHPSQFKIMRRPKSAAALRILFNGFL